MGHVTQTGSGTYSWGYQTKPNERTKLVYITATDSHGRPGQIAFRLLVHH